MIRRNWLDLSRKLVDRFDLDFTVGAIQQFIAEMTLSYWGEGVLATTTYPNPFPITMSGSLLGGTVGNGIAYDPTGEIVRIDPSDPVGQNNFTLVSDPSNPRWDLLCIAFKETGDTPVPKPSDPILTVNLNLHDDYQLIVVAGTPSGSPAYPSKPVGSIILAGLKIPAAATLGSQVAVDYLPREFAMANVVGMPGFAQEIPTGTINGSNKNFVLSQMPLNSASLLVMVDDLVLTNVEWSLVGQTVMLVDAPAVGQAVSAYYITNSPSSQNPLTGAQQVPTGVVDGTNPLFALSGKAANQASTLVMVDGLVIPTSEWNLVQSENSSSIQFLPGSIPVVGQQVYVFYLVNAQTVGTTSAFTPATDYFTLSPTDVSNKFVTLAHNPANPATVLLEVVGDSSQTYGADFMVLGNQVQWSGLGLDGVLASGAKLRAFYLY